MDPYIRVNNGCCFGQEIWFQMVLEKVNTLCTKQNQESCTNILLLSPFNLLFSFFCILFPFGFCSMWSPLWASVAMIQTSIWFKFHMISLCFIYIQSPFLSLCLSCELLWASFAFCPVLVSHLFSATVSSHLFFLYLHCTCVSLPFIVLQGSFFIVYFCPVL